MECLTIYRRGGRAHRTADRPIAVTARRRRHGCRIVQGWNSILKSRGNGGSPGQGRPNGSVTKKRPTHRAEVAQENKRRRPLHHHQGMSRGLSEMRGQPRPMPANRIQVRSHHSRQGQRHRASLWDSPHRRRTPKDTEDNERTRRSLWRPKRRPSSTGP